MQDDQQLPKEVRDALRRIIESGQEASAGDNPTESEMLDVMNEAMKQLDEQADSDQSDESSA